VRAVAAALQGSPLAAARDGRREGATRLHARDGLHHRTLAVSDVADRACTARRREIGAQGGGRHARAQPDAGGAPMLIVACLEITCTRRGG